LSRWSEKGGQDRSCKNAFSLTDHQGRPGEGESGLAKQKPCYCGRAPGLLDCPWLREKSNRGKTVPAVLLKSLCHAEVVAIGLGDLPGYSTFRAETKQKDGQKRNGKSGLL